MVLCMDFLEVVQLAVQLDFEVALLYPQVWFLVQLAVEPEEVSVIYFLERMVVQMVVVVAVAVHLVSLQLDDVSSLNDVTTI